MVFLEALRQFQFVVGRENIMFVHVSLVPVIGAVGEQKSKPTQHSVKVSKFIFLVMGFDCDNHRNSAHLGFRLI